MSTRTAALIGVGVVVAAVVAWKVTCRRGTRLAQRVTLGAAVVMTVGVVALTLCM